MTQNILILSDLHLCEGAHSENEDFFYDAEFAALLAHHEDRNSLLILNGDIVDFLQVTSKGSFENLSENEQRFGLGTDEAKSAFKMRVVMRAHKVFFAALARFLQKGNRAIILPGNHDVEFAWPMVQNELRKNMVRLGGPIAGNNLEFHRWMVYIPGLLYVEHGHQYDPVNAFDYHLFPFLPDNHAQLDLPLGSFLVRYFFNRLERTDPLADNFRPPTKYVGLMARKDPVYVVRILSTYIPCLFRTWVKSLRLFTKDERRVMREANDARMVEVSKVQGIPMPMLREIARMHHKSIMHQPFFWYNAFKSHLWSRSVPLELPTALNIKRLLDVKYVVMGHTHNAYHAKGYYNSGTWTQMVTQKGFYTVGKRLTYVHVENGRTYLREWTGQPQAS